MAASFKPSQVVTASLDLRDSEGDAAFADAPPVWSATPDGLTLTPAADGLSSEIKGAIGKYVVKIELDADLGDGVRFMSETLDVEISDNPGGIDPKDEVSTFGISVSAPRDI